MSTVLLVGVGALGARAGRQLGATRGIDRILVADRRADRAEALRKFLGAKAETVEWSARRPLPPGVDAVACALPAGDDVPLVIAALESGVPIATSGDNQESIATLLRLNDEALASGVAVLAGCGLAPGLSDVLAAHAATLLDTVDEIHVSRAGVAGPDSEASMRRLHSERPHEVIGGALNEVRRRSTHELIWFPEPVGDKECELIGAGVALLHKSFPSAARITVRAVEPEPRSTGWFRRNDPGDNWGATRVEVWGRIGNARVPVIYGSVGRTATIGGAVLGVATALLVGALPEIGGAQPGVTGLAGCVVPEAFLAELDRRGITASKFEGVPVA
ncbi:Saccharopine dehydrogenase [Actinobacteria bacterium IMCC26256]|nr:Saccharopine dehydrogenase [Actinobacteria bacterium IMCC26256]